MEEEAGAGGGQTAGLAPFSINNLCNSLLRTILTLIVLWVIFVGVETRLLSCPGPAMKLAWRKYHS